MGCDGIVKGDCPAARDFPGKKPGTSRFAQLRRRSFAFGSGPLLAMTWRRRDRCVPKGNGEAFGGHQGAPLRGMCLETDDTICTNDRIMDNTGGQIKAVARV